MQANVPLWRNPRLYAGVLAVAALGGLVVLSVRGCGREAPQGYFGRNDVYRVNNTAVVQAEENIRGRPNGAILELDVTSRGGNGPREVLVFADRVKDVKQAANRMTPYVRVPEGYPRNQEGLYRGMLDGVDGIVLVPGEITPQEVERADERWFTRVERGYFDREGPHITLKDPEEAKK